MNKPRESDHATAVEDMADLAIELSEAGYREILAQSPGDLAVEERLAAALLGGRHFDQIRANDTVESFLTGAGSLGPVTPMNRSQ